MIGNFWRKRQEDDLKRLISAYRAYVKASDQAENEGIDREGAEWRTLKGGFGKACHILFKQWPTPNDSLRFEKQLIRWIKKTPETDLAFVCAFNDYLNQKRLNPDELSDVIRRGREITFG